MAVIYSKLESSLAILDELITTGVWSALRVQLFTDDILPTPDTVAGDLTYPTFTGYAFQNVAWGPAFVNDVGQAQANSGVLNFAASADPVSPVACYGYAVVQVTGGALVWSERFEVPKVFAADGDTATFVVRGSMPLGLGYVELEP